MANTINFGWETPDDTDLVKDGAAAIRTLGSAIDASLADLEGGTTGQVLKKNSNTDMDFIWAAESAGMTNPMTTTGDTIYSSSGSTPARLAIGSTGNVLTVAGGVPTWAAPAGGGKLLQMINATTTSATTISTTADTDTGITATITPTSNTSKILILVTSAVNLYRGVPGIGFKIKVDRNGTIVIANANTLPIRYIAGGSGEYSHNHIATVSYLDAPASTSALTYKIRSAVSTTSDGGSCTWQADSMLGSITLLEIGA